MSDLASRHLWIKITSNSVLISINQIADFPLITISRLYKQLIECLMVH